MSVMAIPWDNFFQYGFDVDRDIRIGIFIDRDPSSCMRYKDGDGARFYAEFHHGCLDSGGDVHKLGPFLRLNLKRFHVLKCSRERPKLPAKTGKYYYEFTGGCCRSDQLFIVLNSFTSQPFNDQDKLLF